MGFVPSSFFTRAPASIRPDASPNSARTPRPAQAPDPVHPHGCVFCARRFPEMYLLPSFGIVEPAEDTVVWWVEACSPRCQDNGGFRRDQRRAKLSFLWRPLHADIEAEVARPETERTDPRGCFRDSVEFGQRGRALNRWQDLDEASLV